MSERASDETRGPEHVDLLVLGGWLITMDPERRLLRHGAVAVRESTVVDVGQASDLRARYEATRTVDATGQVVMPGMVNGHRHLLSTPKAALPEGQPTLVNLRDFTYPTFAALGEDDIRVFARRHAAEMLRRGTTTFEEPGCTHLEAALEALAETGIRCRIGPWTWDQQGPAGENCPDWLEMSTDECVARLEGGIRTVRDFGHPLLRDAVTIEGAATCSDALNVAAAELARDADSLCVLHKATSQQEVDLELRAFDHRPVQHLYETGALNEHVLLNHMTCLDDHEVELVAETGARISQNPTSALKLGKGTTQTGKWPELLAAGVPVALGTDSDNASNHHDICRSMYLAALLPRDARRDPGAVTVEQAVEMATIGGATALRWADQIGSLEVGKQADLVVFDTSDYDWNPIYNPIANLVYGVTGHTVDTVVVAGEPLVEGGELVRMDEAELQARAKEASDRILREIGITPAPRWPVS